MGRIQLPALAVLAAILPVFPAAADKLAPDKWVLNCKIDAMTDRRSCTLMYMTAVPGSRPTAWASIGIGQLESGEEYLVAGPLDYACPGKPVMLRVDKNPSVTVPQGPAGGHVVLKAAALSLAEQFRAGNRLVMRAWFVPKCRATDLKVTLNGFTAAWKRFEAELK